MGMSRIDGRERVDVSLHAKAPNGFEFPDVFYRWWDHDEENPHFPEAVDINCWISYTVLYHGENPTNQNQDHSTSSCQ
jgi:hypothetical protein